jgi:cell division protein FtsI/penicillin-binding protein 2
VPQAAALRGLMRAVVISGTGTRAAAPGGPVYGKTGTAEYGDGDPLPTHAWFVGWQGSLAFAVFVEDGASGGSVAAPVAARFLRALR